MHSKPEFIDTSKAVIHGSFLIDTHCHLHMSEYSDDLDSVLERAATNGIKRIITIGIDLQSSNTCIDLARKYKQVSATIGVHPHDVSQLRDKDYLVLEKIYRDNASHIVGFGEIGLDYYKKYSEPSKQRHHFSRQLDMSHELKLPVIIHNREADDDILATLRQAKPLDFGGIMHCFSGDYTYACKLLDLGMLISIPGIITFKNSIDLQAVVKNIPLEAMVLETDGPFLAPVPFRGKRNEPSYLIHTAMKIAEIRQIDVCLVAHQTSVNAENLFSPINH
jgi:TatD DNase family protein